MIPPPMPRGFIPAKDVEWAHFADDVPSFSKVSRRATGRRAQGLRYERRVQEMLLQRYPNAYVPGPWLRFSTGGKMKWCQPDGLLFDIRQGLIIIVEIKYNHTSDAWWQLWELYLPVVRKMFPEKLWRIQTLEIVKWYDAVIPWPIGIRLAEEPHSLPRTDLTCVHIWKP